LLRRTEILFEHLFRFAPELQEIGESVFEEVETRVKYEGYIAHQQKQVEKLKNMENVRLSEDVDYASVLRAHQGSQGKTQQSEACFLWGKPPGFPALHRPP